MVNRVRITQGLPLQQWVSTAAQGNPNVNEPRLAKAAALLAPLQNCDELRRTGVELAGLLQELELDTSSLICGLAYRFVRRGVLSMADIQAKLGEDVAHLMEESLRMANISLLEFSNSPMLSSQSRSQVTNVRNMLVALIDDPRVAVIKLSERVVALRHSKNSEGSRKLRIAQESMSFFAPLANRLGVWRLKWELEDLALRYLDSETYSRIAHQLAGRREEREQRIQLVVEQLTAMFSHLSGQPDASDDARNQTWIEGRAKHIYSIWRKMQRKEIGFSEVYDVNAVRILVPTVSDCYQALGIVHTRWHHIPRELDDYIANPKNNGYRSIHTAVNLEDGRVLEIQIKTHEMHREAELGVCAHWAYKDNSVSEPEDRFYDEKVNWLRKVLKWSEESGSFSSFREELWENIEQDRIYVYTPKGHVLDLSVEATPVDFAYRVHTQVGNHCYSARVDGKVVALNSTLQTGQCIEILVKEDITPDRNWLNPALGYITTTRARAKVQGWFRELGIEQNVSAGEALLNEAVASLGVVINREQLLARLEFDSWDELLYAFALGELSILDIIRYCDVRGRELDQLMLIPMPQEHEQEAKEVTFDLSIECVDRVNLLRDITQVLAQHEFQMLAISAHAERRKGRVRFDLSVAVPDFIKFAQLLGNIKQLNGVIDAMRLIDPEPMQS